MALSQNSSKLATIIILNHILVCFGAHIEILIDHVKKFFRSFEAFYTKDLIDHYTIFKNHLKIIDLNKYDV